MHGIHDIHEEYKGNVERLGPPVKSIEAFGFARAKRRAVSSRQSGWQIAAQLTRMAALIALFLLGCWMVVEGLGWTGQLVQALKSFKHVKPAILIQPLSKRSEIPVLPVEKIIAHSSTVLGRGQFHLHLPLALFTTSAPLAEAIEAIRKQSQSPQPEGSPKLLVSFAPLNSSLLTGDILHESSHPTSLFEAIAFAWCRAFEEEGQFPGKLVLYASSSSEEKACATEILNRAFKLKRSHYTMKISPSSGPSPFRCQPQDVFDCAVAAERLRVRYQKSRACPEMAPLLLACRNEITLDRARRFVPEWSKDDRSQEFNAASNDNKEEVH